MGALPFHNAEHWANFKVLYAYEVLGERHPSVTNDCFGTVIPIAQVGACFAERARADWLPAEGRDYTAISNDTYTGMLYVLREQIGWEPFKCAFRAFNRMEDRPVPTTDLEKLQLWIDVLSHCAQTDLAPFYQEWGYPVRPAQAPMPDAVQIFLPLLSR